MYSALGHHRLVAQALAVAQNPLPIMIKWFFRKPHPGGNFSIERSFRATQGYFEALGLPVPVWYEMSAHSVGVWPRLKLCWEAYQNRTDLNHISGDIHFIALALPGHNTLLTIHDCGFMRHPNPIYRRLLKWVWLDLPVARVKYVTTVSEATKAEVMRFTSCPAEKIRVIPTVIPPAFEPSPRPFPKANPRILHIGSAPNKNLARHIEALAGVDCTLHIIAKLRPEEKKLLERHEIRYENAHNLTDEEIKTAYAHCDLLLFASTLEGFGMPILEAQSVGRPVVTSHCSSMPEVARDSACLVDPFDVSSIRAGVLRVIQDAPYREELIDKGFENIKRYQPETVAEQYAALYAEILSLSHIPQT